VSMYGERSLLSSRRWNAIDGRINASLALKVVAIKIDTRHTSNSVHSIASHVGED